MTSMWRFEGIHWVFIGAVLLFLGVVTISVFFVTTVWTGNVRLLAGVGVGVLLLLTGLSLVNL